MTATPLPVPPATAAWISTHVLAPREIPPRAAECPCQITSAACREDEHDTCGHDYWTRYEGPAPEGHLLRGRGPWPVTDDRAPFRPRVEIWVVGRACRTYCRCRCHQPPPASAPLPARADQLDLFTP
ncbi:hypothetical protein [Streptomyces sp. NPDC049879]|uniref:hypothetical protein n=1 Tax=Streptomyces sp. NPDC049879 TaxID=3365598 RepID=UPI0037A07821